ncbi:MAG: hypothetical protein Q9217_002714 [Psora testacea]
MNIARRTKSLKAVSDAGCAIVASQMTDHSTENIRIGPGAATLSNDVKRVHLDFAYKFNDGHLGARKVWRKYLPRLKYYNPAVSMTVNRHTDQVGPSTLTVYYTNPPKTLSSGASSSPSSSTRLSTKTSSHVSWDRTETIDIKHRHESEILNRLIELTNAVPYQPSAEEMAELEEVKEDWSRSKRDSERQARLNEIKRQEAALLEQARGST